VVIAADGPTAAEVDTFSLRTSQGQVLEFRVDRLDLANGGLPSAHLREHMQSGEPITISYHLESGANVADRYVDAAEQPGPSPTPQATPPPTVAPSAPPTSPPSTAASFEPDHLALTIEPFADGFQDLTFLANAGDGSARLFAVEQRGVLWPIDAAGTTDRVPFLDITDRITSGGEQGLLGLAFHPEFESNGRFFVDYTDEDGNTVVSEFGLAADGTGDPDSERVLLGIEQPFPNHNGGMLAFGSDGDLYIGTGDGGSGGDPFGNGQRLDTLLGKILRIDVDAGNRYGIPADNPFPGINLAGSLPEIWDWGLRNPWRFSFDRLTGALFIGDVGQGAWEEVDAEPAGEGGRNYGWNTMEGTHCYELASCSQQGLTLPVTEYGHEVGCAITGGYVYRGSQFPRLYGGYVFSDSCSGRLWVVNAQDALDAGSADAIEFGHELVNTSSFGEDESGELYVVHLGGSIYRLVVSP
jgi:glucose/arabinose dehydrogenase